MMGKKIFVAIAGFSFTVSLFRAVNRRVNFSYSDGFTLSLVLFVGMCSQQEGTDSLLCKVHFPLRPSSGGFVAKSSKSDLRIIP